MQKDIKDKAAVVAPPPLIFAALLTAGLLLQRVFPVPFLIHARLARLVIGIPLLVFSAVLAMTAFQVMRRRNTAVDPGKPTTAIVAEGPFRFTRNPLYLSLLLLYGAIAVLLDALWPVLLFPALFAALKYGVVIREEKYLEGKFGQEYLRYKNRVRRWI